MPAEARSRVGSQHFQPPPPQYDRGYGKLFLEHVTQANLAAISIFSGRLKEQDPTPSASETHD